MSDLIGKTLGPYRVLEQIGVGGMATVYKAYQPSMDRDIAIKILPHYLSQDEQFAKRFQREAHSIAKLEHPHILPVYDYGKHDDITYIAMRYVPAGTLKERIARGPVPLEEIVRLISQLGGALDYAHRMGIIHRDVKPGNVLIDVEGHTYLTDFGLAHMLEASQQLTATGVGVGTPAYMSPEQGQGLKIDHRSDIYSLGVILYEMVTGHVPFEAETPMALVLKHITEPLPLPRAIAPTVPEAVEKVILKAMAKDPAHRFQTAEEMVNALAAAHQASPPVSAKPAAVDDTPSVTRVALTPQPKPARGQWAIMGGLILVGMIGMIGLGALITRWASRTPTVAPPPTTTAPVEVTPTLVSGAATPTRPRPTSTTTPADFIPLPAVEGKWLIQCANVKPIQICVEDIGEGQVAPVTHDLNFGAAGAFSWSPDGRQIVFSAAQTDTDPMMIYAINADGTDLRPLQSGNAAAWSPDGEWIAFEREDGLWLIHPNGSDAHRVLANQPDRQFYPHIPAWSPDSQRLALLNFSKAGTEVWVVNADGNEPRRIYTAEQTFDGGYVSWSPDGEWIHWKRGKGGVSSDVILPADGNGEPQVLASFPIPDWWSTAFWPQWGREAQALTVRCRIARTEKTGDNTGDIFVQDCDGSNWRRVTEGRVSGGHQPAWSPDGQRLVFDVEGVGGNMSQGLYIVNADGSELTPIVSPDGPIVGAFPVWSPDGRWIAMQDGCDIATVHPDGSGKGTLLAHRRLSGVGDPEMCVHRPMWSPDSQRIAFATFPIAPLQDPSIPGPYEFRFYVVNADGTGLMKLASFKLAYARLEGGASAMEVAWLPTGNQLAFEVREGDKVWRYKTNADGSGAMAEMDSILEAWYPWHWPQWGGKAQTTTLNPQAEQARAFAKPILQAIAGRKPDFADDFSTVDEGWSAGQQGIFAIQAGVARLQIKEGEAFFGNEALNRKDFVLQLEARVAEGDKATQLTVNFHNLSGEYWFYLVVNSAGKTWLVDKRMKGQQPNLANGAGNVSPFGEMTHIMIVARGPRAAIYLNEVPVAYFEDADFDTSGGTLLFCQSPGQAVCEFDTVKFWNLDTVPGLP